MAAELRAAPVFMELSQTSWTSSSVGCALLCRQPPRERDKGRVGSPNTGKLPVQSELGGQAWPGPEVVSPALPLHVRAQVESITFRVVQPPRHGLLELSGRGQRPLQATTFTMDDIYQSRLSYSHDGSSSALRDRFTFTVSDGTNTLFVVQYGGKKVREEKGWQGGALGAHRELPLSGQGCGCTEGKG